MVHWHTISWYSWLLNACIIFSPHLSWLASLSEDITSNRIGAFFSEIYGWHFSLRSSWMMQQQYWQPSNSSIHWKFTYWLMCLWAPSWFNTKSSTWSTFSAVPGVRAVPGCAAPWTYVKSLCFGSFRRLRYSSDNYLKILLATSGQCIL